MAGKPLAGKALVRRCKAHKKTGEQCKLPAIKGGTVCRMHGGSAPQVRAKAQERIDGAAYDLVEVAIKIAQDTQQLAVDRMRAVKEILSRSNEVNQPSATVKHEDGTGVSAAAQELIDAARAAVKRGSTRGKTFSIEDAIDAEVVEEDEDG